MEADSRLTGRHTGGARCWSRQIWSMLRTMVPPVSLTLNDIQLEPPDKDIARAARTASMAIHNSQPLRLTRTVIDRVFIEDAYVYPVEYVA